MSFARFAGMILAGASMSQAAPASPLGRFVGHARVLVISAPRASNALLREQNHALASFSAEIDDRDLIVMRAVGGRASDTRADSLEAGEVRRAVGLAPDRFGVALVGKDGGVKFRRTTPISVTALFKTIDAMPMRQDEMKSRASSRP